jgi:hypothetical protein
MEKEQTHISQKLDDIRQVFQHIIGGGSGIDADIHDKK